VLAAGGPSFACRPARTCYCGPAFLRAYSPGGTPIFSFAPQIGDLGTRGARR